MSDGPTIAHCSFIHMAEFFQNVWRAWLWVRRQVLSTQRVVVWRGDGVDWAQPSYGTQHLLCLINTRHQPTIDAHDSNQHALEIVPEETGETV